METEKDPPHILFEIWMLIKPFLPYNNRRFISNQLIQIFEHSGYDLSIMNEDLHDLQWAATGIDPKYKKTKRQKLKT